MKVDECIQFLADTDEEAGQLKAAMLGAEFQAKQAKAREFVMAEGTMAEKESRAILSDAYKTAQEALENATADFQILANKRNTMQLRFEAWRSMNANRRQAGGNL